jgi:threo-3-hydroxy-L-aspartate ammonia-lyase
MIALRDVRAAAERLAGIAHRTPLFNSRTLDGATSAHVQVKAESFQRAGSFKIRGAYNRVASLPESVRSRGIVAYSSGNHAQAVALAAQMLGTHATIVMPRDAPTVKRAATEGYGAEVVPYDRDEQDRAEVATTIAAERGATLVPPFDDPLVIAGQGTVALEMLEDTELETLVVPVGGGGLIAGCATAAHGLSNGRLRVIGVEPAGADDTRRSLRAGRRVSVEPTTIADGLLSPAPGEMTFPIIQRLVAEVVTVTESEILDALLFLFDRMKLVAEPSGAVAIAALLSGRLEAAGERVGVVLSGGNLGVDRLVQLVASR